MRRRAALLALFIAVAASTVEADRISDVLSDLNRERTLSGVSLSPDAHWAIWNEEPPGQEAVEMVLRDLNTGDTKRIAAPNGGEIVGSSVSWAHDSGEFAFVSRNGAPKQRQVYVMKPGDRQARALTHVNGYVTDVRWSPDNRRVAFLWTENGGGGGPLGALASRVGDVGADIHNQQIAVVDAAGGAISTASDKNLNVYEYDWSPDGKRFVAIAAKGPADNDWWIAKLYIVEGSGNMAVLYAPPSTRQIAIPRWSPDGKRIAFVGGIMSDEGFVGGDIFVVAAASAPTAESNAEDVTPGMHGSASALQWIGARSLLFTEYVEGGGAIATLDVDAKQVQTLSEDSHDLHSAGNFPNLSVSPDAKTWLAVRSDWQHAPEVWLYTGEWKALTQVNSEMKPHWGKAESIHWTNDNSSVQGWLLYPEGFDAAKRYPMIVSIHGGPAGVRGNSWPSTHFDMSAMATLGYFVFFPNPRGSYGEGEMFTRGNIRDFGYGDLRDILTGVDTVLQKEPIDPQRLGVTGWSYGGYMTMWTVTQTTRFRAAVAGAGIANWQSYYGENSIDEWMIPYFGDTVYNLPSVYAKSSPIQFRKNVKTPTLVLVGENDAECPAPQSFEFWHALRSLDVPTRLIVYPGEGHAFNRDKDQLDRMQRAAGWFEQFLASR